MSCYTLNPAFRSSLSAERLVTLSLNGVKQSPDDSAFATLFDVQHYNGSMAFVCVPGHVYQANSDRLEQSPDFIAKDGKCSFDFDSHDAALEFLQHLYGIDTPEDPSTTDRAPAPADASPCPSAIVVPAHLFTPTRLTRRPLSTTALSPNGVMHMSKKQRAIRVFIHPETHSRHLIQAGTHGLTSSELSERLIEYGLSQLESGNTAPLEALSRAASPAPHSTEA
ncbi:hypothetical protein ACIGG6_17455 [Vreelandella lionensis]|uniref:Uncharacterized protein n=1 Tax=Vreelandella lionensis TaxID=1144478 RepID=A0ABW8BX23_9GAMM